MVENIKHIRSQRGTPAIRFGNTGYKRALLGNCVLVKFYASHKLHHPRTRASCLQFLQPFM